MSLAAVGPSGSVTAVDADACTSGAPFTFAEAAERIRRSRHARTTTFLYDTVVLGPAPTLPLAKYDCAVLAHSTWYFASPDRLRRTLARLSDWTDRLYISEWDLVPKEPAQVPHLMAVLFQGAMATLVVPRRCGGACQTSRLHNRKAPFRCLQRSSGRGVGSCELHGTDSRAVASARVAAQPCLARDQSKGEQLPVLGQP